MVERSSKLHRDSLGNRLFDIANYALILFLSFLFLYPFWDTLVLSFSSQQAAQELGVRLWPSEWSVGSYREVLQSRILGIAYLNTIFRTVVGTTLSVLVTYCGAYGLSKKRLPGRNFLMTMIIITMFFSGGLIPRYVIVRSLGLVGSRWALILPILTTAWYLIIARNFISTIPASLEEAAIIDGGHPLTIAFRIMLPLSMPIIAVLVLWIAVWHWNEWFDALIFVPQRSKVVLQLLLRRILIERTAEQVFTSEAMQQSQPETTPETLRAAAIFVSIGPILLLYPFLQKYFVKGVIIGSLKG